MRFNKNDYNNPQVSPGPFKDVTHPPPVDTSDKAKKLQGEPQTTKEWRSGENRNTSSEHGQ